MLVTDAALALFEFIDEMRDMVLATRRTSRTRRKSDGNHQQTIERSSQTTSHQRDKDRPQR
jgi:hypothetical protein